MSAYQRTHATARRTHRKRSTRARLLTTLLAGAATLSLAVGAPAQAARLKTYSGRLEMLHTDGQRGHPDTLTYLLRTRHGRRYRVHFTRRMRVPRAGSLVRLRARRHGHRIMVRRVVGRSARAASLSTQSKKLAVILVNFQNNRSEPFTPEQIRQEIWTGPFSVRSYFAEGSFGALELGSKNNANGDVYGYYTIPYDNNASSSGCEFELWQEAALSAARKAGVELAGYTNIMFVWPESPCGWAGAAWVGGPYSYMNGTIGTANELLAAHELGHNFGLNHAHSLICHNSAGLPIAYSPNESQCEMKEYGDPYDRMGSGSHFQFNNYFKGVLGWWPASAVKTVISSGTFQLQPDETLSEGVHVLRIVQHTYPNGEHQYYYLEFRQPSYFDNWSTTSFSEAMPVEEGVTVRLAGEFEDATGSELLNMNPTLLPSTNPLFEWFAPLMVGESYTDPTSGVQIKTNATGPGGANVSVTFPGSAPPGEPPAESPPAVSPPTVSITAPANGTTASGSVVVSANASDSAGVSSVSLAVDGTTKTTLTNAPYSTSWNTTTVSNGKHTITATAEDASGESASASVTVTVSNSSADTTPPSVPSGLSLALLSSSQAALSWKASTDTVGVAAYEVLRNGTAIATTSGTHFVDPGLAAGKAYSYQVRARDAAGNASAPSAAVKGNAPPVKATGSICGWVSSAATGLPLGGIKVTVSMPGHAWSANTNPSGFYCVANLVAGAYTVAVQATGHPAQSTTQAVAGNAATIDSVAL